MKIKKLKSGSDTYYSCDLLDQSNGCEGFSNIKYLTLEHGEKSTITNNVIYFDDTNEFILESFQGIDNTPVIIEEDIFGNKKAWLKEGVYCENIMEKLKNNNVISINILKEVIADSLVDYYKANKLNISILNGLSNQDRKSAYSNISPKEMLDSFVKAAIEEELTFNIEDNACKVIIKNNTFSNIKEKIKKDAINTIKIKKLIESKGGSLNDLIANTKFKIKLK